MTCETLWCVFLFYLGCVRGLSNEGMPMFRHNEIRGNLYIRIDVEFPEDQFLSDDDLKVRYSVCTYTALYTVSCLHCLS